MNGEENSGLLLTISSYDDNKLIEIFNDTNEGIYRTFAVIKALKNGKHKTIYYQLFMFRIKTNLFN